MFNIFYKLISKIKNYNLKDYNLNNKDIMIKIKRAYEKISKDDGFRILVDRLWPRGVSKEKLAADLWLKDLAPSTELRKWFGHDPEKWPEFKHKYLQELKEKENLINLIKEKALHNNVTLLYSAKDKDHNQALVILDYIKKHK